MITRGIVALAVISGSFASPSSTLPSIEGFSFVLEADRRNVCPEDELVLSYYAENRRDETVRFSPPPAIFLAYGWTIVYLEIRDAYSMKSVEFPVILRDSFMTPDWSPEEITRVFYITLDPHQFVGRRHRMMVDEWKLPPGEFDLRLRYENFGPHDWSEADRIRNKVVWGVLKSTSIRIIVSEDCSENGK